MWGTINPTKPRTPAKLTVAPASRAESASSSVRVVDTCIPRPRAVSSPKARTSNSLQSVNETANAATIRIAAGHRRARDTEEKPPTRKSALPTAASGNSVAMASVPALRKVLTATPPRTTVMREAPVRRATSTTIITAAIPPQNDIPATAHPAAAPPAAQQMETARPAPALTPMMLGEASGFASTA